MRVQDRRRLGDVRFRGVLLPFAVAACLGFADQSAVASSTYSLTDLGALPGTSYSTATAVNNSGIVVGTASPGRTAYGQPFVWSPQSGGQMTQLSLTPNTSVGSAIGINSLGQIVGFAVGSNPTTGFAPDPVLWQPSTDGTYTAHDLGDLIPPPGSGGSQVGAINSAGVILGVESRYFQMADDQAFIWKPDVPNGTSGTMTPLGGPGHQLYLPAINSQGRILGRDLGSRQVPTDRSFLWVPSTPNATVGEFHWADELLGSGVVEPVFHDLNDTGQIVGTAKFDGVNPRGFVWTPHEPNGLTGSLVDIGTLPGQTVSYATDVNAHGVVLGTGTGLRQFLWTPDEGLQRIADLLDASSAGWSIEGLADINDNRWIVGRGVYDPDGPGGIEAVTHAILLRPVPEPRAASMLTGVGATLCRRRRRARQ